MLKNEVVLLEILKEDSFVKLGSYDGAYTKTTMFMLPAINIDIRSRFINKYLNNAFLNDRSTPNDFIRPIFLLFNVKNFVERDWKDFSAILSAKEEYITDYYAGKEGPYNLVMYVFSVPEKWSKEYNLFKNGKYSKFSQEYKDKFPETITLRNGREVESVVWGAMNKSSALKQKIKEELFDKKEWNIVESLDEIWEMPKRQTEIFKYNMYNE